MGRPVGVAPATRISAGELSPEAGDAARTLFNFGATAKAGTVAVLRKPNLAATAVPVGVDVAAPTGTQVPTLAEFNALRATVDALRAVLNRSYLRDDPSLYVVGADALLGIVPATPGMSVFDGPTTALTDGSDATGVRLAPDPSTSEYDAGELLNVTGFRVAVGSIPASPFSVYAKRAAGDGWTLLHSANLAANSAAVVSGVDPGPWRFFRLNGNNGNAQPGVGCNWNGFSVYAGDELSQALYTTAPAVGERILTDQVLPS